jgi:hypothetical protein
LIVLVCTNNLSPGITKYGSRTEQRKIGKSSISKSGNPTAIATVTTSTSAAPAPLGGREYSGWQIVNVLGNILIKYSFNIHII